MTQRKPPGVSMETWVERQIREAQARGEFDNLPGSGKPIPGLDEPYDELWWIKDKMRRENLSLLPPALALRKEAEETLTGVMSASSEHQVRALLGDLNERISAAIRLPLNPPVDVMPFDIDEVVRQWHEARAAIDKPKQEDRISVLEGNVSALADKVESPANEGASSHRRRLWRPRIRRRRGGIS